MNRKRGGGEVFSTWAVVLGSRGPRGRSWPQQVHIRNRRLHPRRSPDLGVEKTDPDSPIDYRSREIATAYGKAQVDWLQDVLSRGTTKDVAKRILNGGLHFGDFQSDSRNLRLRFHSIRRAIAKGDLYFDMLQVRECRQARRRRLETWRV